MWEHYRSHSVNGSCNALPLPGVATLMPLSSCRIIAAYNRCASGVRAALPEHVPLFTLTTVCYTCSPLRDSGPHHYCGSAFRLRSIRLLLHDLILSWGYLLAYPLVGLRLGQFASTALSCARMSRLVCLSSTSISWSVR